MAEQPEPFPAWRYHATEPARIVQNATEDEQLGKGWVDHPDKVKVKKADAPPVGADAPAAPEPEPAPEAEAAPAPKAKKKKE